jgi:nucleoside-diphosphate-sugar epimerase
VSATGVRGAAGSEAGGTKLAITGAGGFIGSALLERAIEQGFPVQAHLGPRDAAVHAAPAGVRTFRAEIDDEAFCRTFVEGADVVIHLAGPPSVSDSWRDPVGCVRAHAGGTARLLEACRVAEVGRFVYVSSAEVYAAETEAPVCEDAPLRPRSPYGLAKLTAERLVSTDGVERGLAARILRLFPVFGPRQRGGVVDEICRQALAGGTVDLQAPGVVRDFCFVADVADAILAAARGTASGGVQTLNVGCGEGISVGMLATRAQAVLGFPARIRHTPGAHRPAGTDVPYLVADARRALEEIGWSARTTLDDGLRLTLASLRSAGAPDGVSPDGVSPVGRDGVVQSGGPR